MKYFIYSIIFSIITVNSVIAQIGGTNTYEFLNLVSSARVIALGGNNIAVKDNDINLASHNPSLLDTNMHNCLSLNFADYFAGINYGNAIYGRKIKNLGTFSTTLQFVNYGKFQAVDNTGTLTGEFNAGDYNLSLGWGKEIHTFYSVGANLKLIYSSLESYQSFGIAADIAGTYHNPKRALTATALIKNIGTQLTAYYPGNKETLPFDIQAGVSKKLEHLPFRFSIIAHHLYKFDIRYDDPSLSASSFLISSTEQKQKKYIADKMFRHIIIGGELLLSKNINIRIGYNHLRRQELVSNNKFSTVGFSWGVGVNIKKFQFSYGRAIIHSAGPSNNFTVSTNLSEFFTSPH